MYIYIYIYTYGEIDGESCADQVDRFHISILYVYLAVALSLFMLICICIYIYIYIYTYLYLLCHISFDTTGSHCADCVRAQAGMHIEETVHNLTPFGKSGYIQFTFNTCKVCNCVCILCLRFSSLQSCVTFEISTRVTGLALTFHPLLEGCHLAPRFPPQMLLSPRNHNFTISVNASSSFPI